jgi:hypothetical protein
MSTTLTHDDIETIEGRPAGDLISRRPHRHTVLSTSV